ncbi:MAG: hypothetical protein U1A77_19245 [Pirellulales bacterium]
MDRLHRFVNLLSVATADGSLSEREVKFLSQRAREWGLSDHQFAIAVNRSLEHPGEFEIPRRRSEREELLRDMLSIMAADGRLQDVEKQLFAIVAAHMKFSAAEIDSIIVDLASKVPPGLPPTAPSLQELAAGEQNAEKSVESASEPSVESTPRVPTKRSAKPSTKRAKSTAPASTAKQSSAKKTPSKGASHQKAAKKPAAKAASQKSAPKKPAQKKPALKKPAKSKPVKVVKKSTRVAARAKKGKRS